MTFHKNRFNTECLQKMYFRKGVMNFSKTESVLPVTLESAAALADHGALLIYFFAVKCSSFLSFKPKVASFQGLQFSFFHLSSAK